MRWSIICLLVLSLSGAAFQDKKKSDDTPKGSVRGTLPPLYRKLDLQDEQVRKLHKIHDEYGNKIVELQKQIEKLKDAMAEEMEKELTAEQRRKLKELRTGEKASDK